MASTTQSQATQSTPMIQRGFNLPIAQLESLKFKAAQIIDSIYGLQRTIDNGYSSVMASWPDVLSKYNILLSQTHNFMNALVQPFPSSSTSASTNRGPPANPYERIALHPNIGMPDAQLDGEVVPLLRNQQTTEVLRMENDTVKRIAEHMTTRGSLAVLGLTPPPPAPGGFGAPRKPEYEDVLKECKEIREAHDRRVERAIRAVDMLKDKFDWKQRVEVEVEEPEELGWDPRFSKTGDVEDGDPASEDDANMASASDDEDGDEAGTSDEDEFNVEGALVNGDSHSPAVGDGDLFGASQS